MIAVAFATVIVGSVSWAYGGTWPTVRALHLQQTFLEKDNSDTPLTVFVRDTSGSAVYKFECHNGDYDDESEINFSGDFQCALFAIEGGVLNPANLLAADTKDERSTDWWNRGRMRADQLRGECLMYKEYSTDRHFRVRGMLVTMKFTNVAWSPERDLQGHRKLERFTFTLDIVSDPSARNASAEVPPGAKPPDSCYP